MKSKLNSKNLKQNTLKNNEVREEYSSTPSFRFEIWDFLNFWNIEEEERIRSELEVKENKIRTQVEEEVKELRQKLREYQERGYSLSFISSFLPISFL
jgi:uncharacterized protein YhaN